ncbi:class I SAM-dependent methyltransferase [Ruminococcus sp.]|uniref:class I SAM-dependent methyltransferase n=1 Tax=Ruminococcus sp. TaxID=41978 RepID=UPI00388EB364
MNTEELKQIWLKEQEAAHIHGWDFSHICGRFEEENDLPWDYKQIVLSYLKDDMKLLDIDTGGGEFLLSLHHPYHNTSATEGYPPNVLLCERTLFPFGIDFKEMSQYDGMPFDDNSFDIVINKHGNYNVGELYRVIKPNGLFITQQVGSHNDRELIELLCPDLPKSFSNATLQIQSELFQKEGFSIIRGEEAYCPIKFYDVGALVWFARIIEWEFPGFSVESNFAQLIEAQRILDQNDSIDGTIHRYLIVAKKQKE